MELEDLGGTVSFWQKALWVFTSPTRCFEALREKPDWLKPWLLAALVGLVPALLFVYKGHHKEQAERIIDHREESSARSDEDYKPLSEEERRQQVAAAQSYTAACVLTTPILGTLLALLLVSGVIHVVAGIAGLAGRFPDMMSVWAYSSLVRIPEVIIVNALSWAADGSPVALNLAAFFGLAPASSVPAALLAHITPFGIWHLIIASIGLSVVRQGSRNKGLAVIFGLWLLLVLISTVLPYTRPTPAE